MKKLLLFSMMAAFVMSCGMKKSGDKELLAVVDGEKITLGDLKAKNENMGEQLFRLEENVYKVKEYYLNEVIESKLIDIEAKKRNIKPEDLINQEVTSKIKPVSDEEAIAFAKGKIPDNKVGEYKDRIKMYLAKQQEAEVKKAFADSLRGKYKVDIKIKKPKKAKMEIKLSGDEPSKGGDRAKITIVEFSEFQCPFCKRASTHGAAIIKEYGDKVKYVFKHFPLSFHEKAHRASEASLCMHEQGKFFEYHDKLFENNQALEDADLKKYATEVGGDSAKFEECLKSGRNKAKVDKDLADGQKYGVSGAPTFFINGEPVVGAVPYEELKKAIDDAIKG